MKIAIVGDVHIHNHQNNFFRLEDCLKSIEDINNYCDQNNINTIIFLGDIYHLRDSIPSIVLYNSYLLFEKLAKNKQLFAIAGNHDMPYKNFVNGLNNIRHLSSLMNIGAHQKYFNIVIDNCCFWLMHYLENANEIKEILKEIESKIHNNNYKYNILCGHFDIESFYMESNIKSKSSLKIEDFKAFDKVFSGHFHSYQEKDNVIYVGSTIQLTFNDSGVDKGFVVFDTTDCSHNFIRLQCRQFISYKIDKVRQLSEQEIKRMEELFKDNIVKIEIGEYLGAEWLITLKKRIEERFKPKYLRIECADTNLNININDNKYDIDNINVVDIINNNIIDMIETWINSINIEERKKIYVKNVVNEIINQ